MKGAGKSGFTMIEIIFALFIYSLGLILVSASFTAGLRSISHAAQVEECRSRAGEYIENVKSSPPPGSSLPLTDEWTEVIGIKKCDVKREIYADEGNIVVVIYIKWAGGGNPVTLAELVEE